MESCISAVKTWMVENKLQLNGGKTEVLLIGREKIKRTIHNFPLNVCGSSITPSVNARNLGVQLDSALRLDTHINQICASSYNKLRNIARIRRFLTQDVAQTIVHAFVTSKLDYCNSLFYGVPNVVLRKLQGIQNAAVRVVSSVRKYDHLTPIYKELHWLPVRKRIEFKILLLTYKALTGSAPQYICSLIQQCESTRYSLRSSFTMCLNVPRTNLVSAGDRAFCVAAPKMWNSLPNDIRMSHNVESFKKKLKTHLFCEAYSLAP